MFGNSSAEQIISDLEQKHKGEAEQKKVLSSTSSVTLLYLLIHTDFTGSIDG